MKYGSTALTLILLAMVSVAAGTPTTTPTAPMNAEDNAPKNDIVDTAVGAGSFKTLAVALKAADLIDTLKGEGPFTVFAPTDNAFDTLGKDVVADLVRDQKRFTPNFRKIILDDGHLHAVLTYHVVKERLTVADLRELAKGGKSLTTVNGAKLKLTLEKDALRIERVGVVTADVEAKNGIIHVIDRVLLPPAPLKAERYTGARAVPCCPPADEPFIWQRATTLASPKSDREKLVTFWKAAGEQTPPKGDETAWKERVGKLANLGDEYAKETDPQKMARAAAALKKSADCIGCHAAHQNSPFDRFGK